MKKNSLKIIIFTLIMAIYPALPGFCFGEINYGRVYQDMPILDHIYETGRDPEEPEDYENYFVSPYVLTRIPLHLRNQKTLIRPGYYLVKPERKDGYDFVIFKQKGIVKGVIPVYKKYFVNPAEIFPEPEKPKIKWYKKPFIWAWNVIKWPFKKIFKQRQVSIPPRAKLETQIVENGRYYDMGLYVEDRLYKLLFLIER